MYPLQIPLDTMLNHFAVICCANLSRVPGVGLLESNVVALSASLSDLNNKIGSLSGFSTVCKEQNSTK